LQKGKRNMAQMILYLCRDTNIKVMNILSEISKKEDVTEFITTIQLVQITINGLLKSKKEFKFELLKDLQNSLKDYETLLVQLNGTGKLLRILTSSRLRRKIEHANSEIHKKLEIFRASIKEEPDATKNGGSAENKANSANNTDSNNPEEEASALVEEIVENSVRLTLMIEDQDGKDLWDKLFGLESFMIEWDKFLLGMKKILTDIKEDEETVLQYILDNSNTGFINQHKFSEFLKGFGPVQDCIKNIKNILSARWFYGFLSRTEIDLLLRDQPVGCFLIRFSSSQPGSFALAFSTVNANGEKVPCHILINSCKPLGFQVQEQENQDARTFQNLYELVDFYSVFLQLPFSSDLPFESWFEGDFSAAETQEVLAGHKPGTFLVRFSSQVGAFAVSFVGVDGQISHSLIEHEGVANNGYKIVNDGQPLFFGTLKEVVSYYGDALKFPIKNTSNELHVEATKLILQWKRERAKQMEAVDRIVSDLFDVTKESITDGKRLGEPDPRVEAIVSRLFSPV